MALVVGDEVARARALGDETLQVCPSVLFGTVMVVTTGPPATVDVLWENGAVAEGVPPTLLDKIDGTESPQDVVTFTDGTGGVISPEYQGVVVRRYSRQNNGADAAPQFVLARSISSGQTWEALASAVEAVPGR